MNPYISPRDQIVQNALSLQNNPYTVTMRIRDCHSHYVLYEEVFANLPSQEARDRLIDKWIGCFQINPGMGWVTGLFIARTDSVEHFRKDFFFPMLRNRLPEENFLAARVSVCFCFALLDIVTFPIRCMTLPIVVVYRFFNPNPAIAMLRARMGQVNHDTRVHIENALLLGKVFWGYTITHIQNDTISITGGQSLNTNRSPPVLINSEEIMETVMLTRSLLDNESEHTRWSRRGECIRIQEHVPGGPPCLLRIDLPVHRKWQWNKLNRAWDNPISENKSCSWLAREALQNWDACPHNLRLYQQYL